jgi:hypothetical protein
MSRLTARSESLLLSFRLLTTQLEPDIYIQRNTFVTCMQLQRCFLVIASETRTKLTLIIVHWTSMSPDMSSWPSCIMPIYGLLRSLAVFWYWHITLHQARSQTINTVGDTAAIASAYTYSTYVYIRVCTQCSITCAVYVYTYNACTVQEHKAPLLGP